MPRARGLGGRIWGCLQRSPRAAYGGRLGFPTCEDGVSGALFWEGVPVERAHDANLCLMVRRCDSSWSVDGGSELAQLDPQTTAQCWWPRVLEVLVVATVWVVLGDSRPRLFRDWLQRCS